MLHLDGFAPLAARYDGFILDLWGVIHDGVTPYPGAVDCLRHLKALGKPAILLSNAPRRAHVAAEAMRGMGIGAELYTGIVTSGEVTHTLLRDRDTPEFAALGRRLYHLGPERDRNVFAGLDVDVADAPARATAVWSPTSAKLWAFTGMTCRVKSVVVGAFESWTWTVGSVW